MCFLIKKHLTHKILPLLALFLLIFNLFVVSEVHASSSDVGEFEQNIVDYVKSLPQYSQYDYHIVKYFEGDGMQNVDCIFFNDVDVKFYFLNNAGNWVLQSSKSLSYYQHSFNINNFNVLLSKVLNGVVSSNIRQKNGKYPIFSNTNIYYDGSNNLWYDPVETFSYPYISQDVGNIETFIGSGIDIFPGSYQSDSTLNFSVQHLVGSNAYESTFSCDLNADSSYYLPMYSLDNNEYVGYRYGIFYSDMGNFVVGDTYRFVLTYAKSNGIVGIDVREVVIKGKSTDIGKGTDEIKQTLNEGFGELKVEFQQNTDKIIESNNKTQEALKENNETNKNIFQKIGDILNILNPFSENFFAYKLIELLLDALKSLFIPSDNFFNNWLADLNEYFRR